MANWKARTEGHGRSEDPHYGLLEGMICPWDLSEAPSDNSDRKKKLGKGASSRAAVVCDVGDNLRFQIEDGFHDDSQGVPSIVQLEPDNWIPRLHVAKGRGVDNVLSLRLIAEHENLSSSRENRGTMVVNQKNKQGWAWLNDIAWLRNFSSAVEDEEIQLNDAGFLPKLYKKGSRSGANATRHALATPVPRNGGFVTDGLYDGQWSQAGKFIIGPIDQPQKPGTATPDSSSSSSKTQVGPGPDTTGFRAGGGAGPQGNTTGGTGDVSQTMPNRSDQTQVGPGGGGGKGNPGQTQVAQPKAVEWGMRADCGIDFGGGVIGRLANEPDGPAALGSSSDEKRLVRLFVDTPGSPDDHLDTEVDDSSNHPRLPKRVQKKVIHGVVRIPKQGYKPYETGDHHSSDESKHDYSYHGTGTGGNGGSSGGSPMSSGYTYAGDSGLGQDNTGSKAPVAEEANPGGAQGDPQKDAKLTRPGLSGYKEFWDNDAGTYKPMLDTNGQPIPN